MLDGRDPSADIPGFKDAYAPILEFHESDSKVFMRSAKLFVADEVLANVQQLGVDSLKFGTGPPSPKIQIVRQMVGKNAASFIADATAPQLMSFSLDMNANQLWLTFDEVVQAASLDMRLFTLQSMQHAAAAPSSVTFTSTKVEANGKDRLNVTGDLTIRGVTRPVTLDVEFNGRAVAPWGS